MRLCEEHRLGGIPGVSADECVGCAYRALRESLEPTRAALKAEREYANRLYSRLQGYEDPPARKAPG